MDLRTQDEILPLQLLAEATLEIAGDIVDDRSQSVVACCLAAAPALNIPFHYGHFSQTMLRYARAHETSPGQYPVLDVRSFGFCLMHPSSATLVRTFVDLVVGRSPMLMDTEAANGAREDARTEQDGDAAATAAGDADGGAGVAASAAMRGITIPEEDEDDEGLDDAERVERRLRREARQRKAFAVDPNAVRQLEHNLAMRFDRDFSFVHDVRMRRMAGALDEDAAAAADAAVDWELEGFASAAGGAPKRVAPKPTRAAELKALVSHGKLPSLRRGAQPPPRAPKPAPELDPSLMYETRPVEVRTTCESSLVAQIQRNHAALQHLVRLALDKVGVRLTTGVLLRTLLTQFINATHIAPAMSLFEVCLRATLPPVPSAAERVEQRKREEEAAMLASQRRATTTRRTDDAEAAAERAAEHRGVECGTQTSAIPTKVRLVYMPPPPPPQQQQQHPHLVRQQSEHKPASKARSAVRTRSSGAGTSSPEPNGASEPPPTAAESEPAPARSSSPDRTAASATPPAHSPSAPPPTEEQHHAPETASSAASPAQGDDSTAATSNSRAGDSSSAGSSPRDAAERPTAQTSTADEVPGDRASKTDADAAPPAPAQSNPVNSSPVADSSPPSPSQAAGDATTAPAVAQKQAVDDPADDSEPPITLHEAAASPDRHEGSSDGANPTASASNTDAVAAAPAVHEAQHHHDSPRAPPPEPAWFEGDGPDSSSPAAPAAHEERPRTKPDSRKQPRRNPQHPVGSDPARRPITAEDASVLASPGAAPSQADRRESSQRNTTGKTSARHVRHQRNEDVMLADRDDGYRDDVYRDDRPLRGAPRNVPPMSHTPQPHAQPFAQAHQQQRSAHVVRPAPIAASREDIAPSLQPLLLELAGKYQVARGGRAVSTSPPRTSARAHAASAGAAAKAARRHPHRLPAGAAQGEAYAQRVDVALGLRKTKTMQEREAERRRKAEEEAWMREQDAGRRLTAATYTAPPQFHMHEPHHSLVEPVQRPPLRRVPRDPSASSRAVAAPSGGAQGPTLSGGGGRATIGGVPFEQLPRAEQRRVVAALAEAVAAQERDLQRDSENATTTTSPTKSHSATTKADQHRRAAAAKRRDEDAQFEHFMAKQRQLALFEAQERDLQQQRADQRERTGEY